MAQKCSLVSPKVPQEKQIPLIIALNTVLFPGETVELPVRSSKNYALVQNFLKTTDGLKPNAIIGVVSNEVLGTLAGPASDSPDLHSIGTATQIKHVVQKICSEPTVVLTLKGLWRFRLDKVVSRDPYAIGKVTQLDYFDNDVDKQVPTVRKDGHQESHGLVKVMTIKDGLHTFHRMMPSGLMSDITAGNSPLSYTEKLRLLDTIDSSSRMKLLVAMLGDRAIPGFSRMKLSMPRIPSIDVMRRFGSGIDEKEDLKELTQKLTDANLPPSVHKVAFKELSRLKKLSSMNPESGSITNYLELIAELPWDKSSTETLDIIKAKHDLNVDHYAMDKVKRRVLEYLAVRQLKSSLRGPILCFVGPPGVGKTSIGRSIALTLGRKFHRISLGGICNQSDVRGHRRTYIGSMSGRIIQGLKSVGTNNPVMLLDEIDKVRPGGLNGDPSAALLEVLDPEQNCNFVDHYLNVPFDLSKVMFIATANSVKTIPVALLDRMEVIKVQGYTQEEKLNIAMRHLLPKQLKEHGITEKMLQLPESSVENLVACYTREAGVRNLERKLAALCRAVAVKVATMKSNTGDHVDLQDMQFPIFLDLEAIKDILGPAAYSGDELWFRAGLPGVVVGLAWTSTGGEALVVETNRMEGKGELILTGHLGSVIKESATLAFNWFRTSAIQYGIKLDREELSHTDIHIHFPAGAVGKDGPSAGITIATALVSLFTERPVAMDIAMTGELTLRGLVLQVGGIKEKVLAAHRAGLKRVVLPEKCKKDLHGIPENIKNNMTFIFASHIDEVLQAAFDGGFSSIPDQVSTLSKL